MKHILYARVSTKKQGDSGLGLDAQRTIAYRFFPDIHMEFVEVQSGKTTENRPVLAQAIEHCRQTGDILVVAKVDRLSRSAEDGLRIMRELDGKFRTCDLPGVPDKFTMTLLFAIAERERELISIRTKGAMEQLKKQGKKLGAPHRLTRDLARKGSAVRREQSVCDEHNIRAKSLAVVLREKGLSLQATADELNRAGFKTSTGNKWHKTSVSRLWK